MYAMGHYQITDAFAKNVAFATMKLYVVRSQPDARLFVKSTNNKYANCGGVWTLR